jgi:hypothetical protein
MIQNTNNESTFQNSEREMNKTIDDPCAIQLRSTENNKKFKFITTNHVDLLDAKQNMNFFGIGLRDQLFVPAEQIGDYSKLLNGEIGTQITNMNVKYGLGPLPLPTLPSRYQQYHGNIEVEDSFKNQYDTKKNSCNPRETAFHNRFFYLFDDSRGVETPDASKTIEPIQFGPRGGIHTRMLARPPKK